MLARVAPAPDGATAVPVVLVHGVIVSSRYLLPLGVELARDGAVVAPDLPGFGHSSPRALSLPVLADAVIDAAAACGHDRVALVGNSFGAQVAVEAAVRWPGVVDRLVLLGPTVDPSARSLAAQGLRWVRNAPDEHPSSVALMARDLVDLGVPRAAAALRVMLADRIEDKLGSLRCDVLVVRGARDRVAPAGWCDAAAARAGGRCVSLSAGAHMAHYARALETAAALRPFLAA
ncbi:MAG TPA: alpha/beta hydrolase [Capillimicrobium sp.]|jgi:pimeloyl-ACP methyl ester carboxylesterase